MNFLLFLFQLDWYFRWQVNESLISRLNFRYHFTVGENGRRKRFSWYLSAKLIDLNSYQRHPFINMVMFTFLWRSSDLNFEHFAFEWFCMEFLNFATLCLKILSLNWLPTSHDLQRESWDFFMYRLINVLVNPRKMFFRIIFVSLTKNPIGFMLELDFKMVKKCLSELD